MKTLQLFPYAVAILFAGFVSAASPDAPEKESSASEVRIEAKFVEAGSGTEGRDSDWVVRPFPQKEEDKKADAMYDVLAMHKTLARFEGFKQIVCRGRTALCPDRCGHSTVVAVFTIASYLDHHKGGEYGDGKQKMFEVDVLHPAPGQPESVVEAIDRLKPGDIVRLDWLHLYMHDGGAHYPARPVNNLAPAKLPEGVALPPVAEPGKFMDQRPQGGNRLRAADFRKATDPLKTKEN